MHGGGWTLVGPLLVAGVHAELGHAPALLGTLLLVVAMRTHGRRAMLDLAMPYPVKTAWMVEVGGYAG